MCRGCLFHIDYSFSPLTVSCEGRDGLERLRTLCFPHYLDRWTFHSYPAKWAMESLILMVLEYPIDCPVAYHSYHHFLYIGKVFSTSAEVSEEVCRKVLKIYSQACQLTPHSIRRITISCSESNFVVTSAERTLYLVKVNS